MSARTADPEWLDAIDESKEATTSAEARVSHMNRSASMPQATGQVQRGVTLGRMTDGLNSFFYTAHPEELQDLRARRHMTGLFHLNSRLDVIDAGTHAVDITDGKPSVPETPDPNIVVYDGPDDPLDPQNWPFRTKILQTALLGVATAVVTYASSVFSTTVPVISEIFHVSTEVAILSTSLFLAGYVAGPACFGPASEFLGRRTPLLASYFGFMIFSIPPAVAHNLETIMLGRFFAGFMASGPLSIVAGAFSDYWGPEERGGAITVYAVAAGADESTSYVAVSFVSNIGPNTGYSRQLHYPEQARMALGAFDLRSELEKVSQIAQTSYITVIWAALILILMVFFLKESFTPVILQQKAKTVRYETKNWAIRSKLDERPFSFGEVLRVYVSRPIVMLASEPILFLVTLYSGFVYAVLYLTFGAVPYVFEVTRGESPGTTGLVFLSVFVGMLFAGAITMAFTPRYNRKLHAKKAVACPEERTLPMIVGGAIFPIGFFIFGWTSPEYVSSPWPEIVALGMIGCGVLLIFLSSINLLVDCYLMYANSAVAANTMFRSGLAAAFPLVATISFRNLGTQWASTMLGCLALAFAPFPIVFWFYADTLIQKSKYAPKFPPKPTGPIALTKA